MSDEPRYVPRFIPTLTEVVDPATLNVVTTTLKPDEQALVDAVLLQLRPLFEQRMQEQYEQLVKNLLSEPWRDVSSRLQAEMQSLVRQTVSDYLAQQEQSDESIRY